MRSRNMIGIGLIVIIFGLTATILNFSALTERWSALGAFALTGGSSGVDDCHIQIEEIESRAEGDIDLQC